MGFFSKLFEKKICDVCGGEIGLLGNRKLEDGNLCKECASKLSYWFSDRRESTIAEIKEQLAYREENKNAVAQFNATRTFSKDGGDAVWLDDDAGKFMVVRTRNVEEENPDVLDCTQITSCQLDVSERRHEKMRTNSEGERVSYNPPRYTYNYDFYMELKVKHPYFDDMRFKLNNSSVDVDVSARLFGSNNPTDDPDYREFVRLGDEIKEALLEARVQQRQQKAEADAPRQACTCPWCGATTTGDASGCCEYCGGALKG